MEGIISKKYDEHQVFMKYKRAYYSFNFLKSLLLINTFLGVILGFRWEWGTTKEVEILVIIPNTTIKYINRLKTIS